MGTTYNAKLNVNCAKQHVCLGCQAEYRYQMDRAVTGSGSTQEAAAMNAQAAAVKSLEHDVDQHACPHCGMMQPDMIAEVRKQRFVLGTWLGPLIVLVAFFIALPHWLTISTSAMIAVAGVALSTLCFVSGVFFNPNKDMAAGQMASAAKVQGGELFMVKDGLTTTVVDDVSGPTSGHWIGLLLGGTALVGVLAPLLLPAINGWQLNDTYPAVVGPGDTTCIYFDQSIRSLKGMWYGSVIVSVTNEEELGGPQNFRGSSKQSSWGNTISGKNISNQSHAMWVEVTVPDSSDLTDKSVDLDLRVNANYPLEQGGGFVDEQGTFQQNQTLILSSPDGGATYWSAWLYGQLGAVGLMIVAGVILMGTAKALVRTANTPSILVADDDQPDAGADDEEYADDDDYAEESE